MAENSSIEWTTHTFNPWVGCMKVSPGCKHCYASVNTFTRAQRSQGHELWGPASTTDRHVTSDAKWREPVKWNREAEAAGVRARVFCASMADVFEDHPALPPVRERLWPLIEATPWLDWQLLTKRPENVLGMVPIGWSHDGWPPNAWVGTSVEDQQLADERIPELLMIPAAVRFLSCEPLLGPVDLTPYLWRAMALSEIPGWALNEGCTEGRERRHALHWIIAGGESGPKARPCDVAWIRSLVQQARDAAVPVFVKQLGARPVEAEPGKEVQREMNMPFFGSGWSHWRLRNAKGGDMSEWSEDLRVREMPSS